MKIEANRNGHRGSAVRIAICVSVWMSLCQSDVAAQNDLIASDVRAWIEIQNALDKTSRRTFDRFVAVVGHPAPYSMVDIKKFVGAVSPGPAAQDEEDDDYIGNTVLFGGSEDGPFQGLKVRKDHDDVLTTEDPSQSGAQDDMDDISGASASYARDLIAGADTWSLDGALIAPFSWSRDVFPNDEAAQLKSYGIAPSVSYSKLNTQLGDKDEVDSLVYRIGLHAKYEGGFFASQTFRAFAAYETDSSHLSETPAIEFEYEPVLPLGKHLALGTRRALLNIPNPDPDADLNEPGQAEKTILAYQLRARLYGVYGETSNAGDKEGVPESEFFRFGPKLDLTLKPFFLDRLAGTVGYKYLFDSIGESPNNSLLKAELMYFFDKEERFSIKATYEKGGIDLTQEDAETFLLGIGIKI